jgi:hypothetical protein
MFMTVKVQAVTLTITATAVCDNQSGGWNINYTASVSGNGGVSNPSVNILFDGGVVGNGAFVDPAFGFSGSADAPAGKGAGDSVTVALNVVGVWSNGTLPGDADNYEETTVTLPGDCVPPGVRGCTPGYWKVPQHWDSWVDPYDPTDSFNALPGFADVFPGYNLVQVLSFQGGGIYALGRHTVAAILNIAAGTGYGLTLTEVQDGFNAAVASGDYETFKNQLEIMIERRCPLNSLPRWMSL